MIYFSTASLSAQSANINVMGAKVRFSAETPEARLPNAFNDGNANTIRTRVFTAPANLPVLTYPSLRR